LLHGRLQSYNKKIILENFMLTPKHIIPYIVSLALFMEALDTTIINTAIPAMARSLQVNPINLKIALISYLLSLAIFIPISGWVGDKFGIKRIFISALAVFTLSSVWCGFAHNLLTLVVARTLQGLGGSFMLPLGRLVLMRTIPRNEFFPAMSRVVMVAALGMMLGPVLGGLITHYFSWQWIFWVNIPAGILTIFMSMRWLENTPPQAVPPLDTLGFILFGTSLAGFTFGLSAFSEPAVSEHIVMLIIATSLGLLGAYVWHSHSQQHPIVKTKLFHSRPFQISIIGNLICRLGFGGLPFLLPLLLQVSLGYSSQLSGMLLAPTALGVFMVKPLSLRVLRFLGYKRLLILNTVLVGLVMWMFMSINSGTPIYVIGCMTFIFGFLISLQYSGMNSLAYAEIAPPDLSAATSIISTAQQLSQSFGVAAAAVLIRYFTPVGTTENFSLTVGVFQHTFFTMGIVTLLSMFIFMRLHPQDGQEMIKVEERQGFS
jgi:EmrB/QacA subfamily drug resistance transporter